MVASASELGSEFIYAKYQRTDDEWQKDSNLTRQWQSINQQSAEYQEENITVELQWDKEEKTNAALELLIKREGAQQSKQTYPRMALLEEELSIDTKSSKAKIFSPKNRTIKVADDDSTIKAKQAILLVKLMEDEDKQLSLEYYVPEIGLVASKSYFSCPKDIELSDDAEYYQQHCGSEHSASPDKAKVLTSIKKADEGNTNTAGSCQGSVEIDATHGGPSGDGNGQQLIDELCAEFGDGDYQLRTTIVRVHNKNLKVELENIALARSEQEICSRLNSITMAHTGANDSGLNMFSQCDPGVESPAVSNPILASQIWVRTQTGGTILSANYTWY